MQPVRFEIEQGNEELVSHSGLAMAGWLLGKTQLAERVDEVRLAGRPRPEIPHSDVLKAMIGLLCLGKPDFDAIEPFREDPFFALSLGLQQTPSSPTLRQRLDEVHGEFDTIILEESARMVRRHASVITTCHGGLTPLDLDLTPFDNSGSHKEGVSYIYKGYDGYGVCCGYLGVEGYLVNIDLRQGKQHCQKGMEEFLREAIGYSRIATDAPLLVRMDSGNDSIGNVKVCLQENVEWVIKRNLRSESSNEWVELALDEGKRTKIKDGIYGYYGDVYREREEIEVPLRIVYEVIERTVDKTGNELLFPRYEVNTFWTSLKIAASEVVELYHQHATSEQFHSEIKTDMDLERLPSGKFDTNSLILLLGLMAYNILRLMGQETLREDEETPPEQIAPIRKKVHRRRLRNVIQDLIYLAARLVYHARRWKLTFGRNCPWYGVWRRVALRFSSA